MQRMAAKEVHGVLPYPSCIGSKLLLQALRDIKGRDIRRAHLACVYTRPNGYTAPARLRVGDVAVKAEALLASYEVRINTSRRLL